MKILLCTLILFSLISRSSNTFASNSYILKKMKCGEKTETLSVSIMVFKENKAAPELVSWVVKMKGLRSVKYLGYLQNADAHLTQFSSSDSSSSIELSGSALKLSVIDEGGKEMNFNITCK